MKFMEDAPHKPTADEIAELKHDKSASFEDYDADSPLSNIHVPY